MKEIKIYRCIDCGHELKTAGWYRSPCPICRGPMVLCYNLLTGEETVKAASHSNRREGILCLSERLLRLPALCGAVLCLSVLPLTWLNEWWILLPIWFPLDWGEVFQFFL